MSFVSGVTACIVAAPSPLEADIVVRLVNGREIVAREHWYAGSRMSFTAGRGTVTVPRSMVAAIEARVPAAKIGVAPQTVNATPLVASESFR
jgi:hypothetical protein